MKTESILSRLRRTGMTVLCPAILMTLTFGAAQAQWVSTATKALPLKNATLLGAVPASTPMHIVVGLQVRNQSQIQPTLKRMITAGDPLYGQFFTVSQFVAQFGPTTAQVQAVENYLSSYGFKNLRVEENQLLVQGDATAGAVEAAFNTSLAQFSENGKTLIANTVDAQVPMSLAGTVSAVLGLNNVQALHTGATKLTACSPGPCGTPDPANEVYSPWQYQIAYDAAYPNESNPNATGLKQKLATGSTTSIGIIAEGNLGCINKNSNCPVAVTQPPPVSGAPNSNSTGVIHDLYLFEQFYKLPATPVTIVYAGIPSPDTSGAGEWDLDSQSSTGIAVQAKNLYFYVATSLTDSDIALAINKAVTDNKVKGFNMSFGECEDFPYLDGAMTVDDIAFAEAALQGITPFASSDDQGSACPVVGTNGVPLSGPPDTSYPASSPYVIASGGTNLLTQADYTYSIETAWEASGGGPSYFETPPFWQAYKGSGTVAIVPSAEINSQVGCPTGCRGVPDVAMCAGGTGLAICSANTYVAGTTELIGGTSLSSPLSMGSWARIVADHLKYQKVNLGFAGPLIYQLANGAAAGPPPVAPSSLYFNDVQTGSNGLFSALPGYDYVTGLGSWDIYQVNKNLPTTYPH
ncbi:MAG: S8/S53 family peptidase [Acidobacteriaceae bacterium]|nr:S8/S53 family peptidase [Acidobacteriaceae bacterium]MBV9778793.1 S8/S53 family peptidase [Acidobacteriaceae bacterium]